MPVTVSQDRLIAATPTVVWTLISDPAMLNRLDPRCTLESTTGESGSRGSSYAVTIKEPRVSIRAEYTVVESEPGSQIVLDVAYKGRKVAQQSAEILPVDGFARLRWSSTQSVVRLWRRVSATYSERQITRWLDAVEREACLA